MTQFDPHILFSNPIGVFDSGSGGLSILESIREILPHESYIYVGDHANNPYGDKKTEFIRERTVAVIQFFTERNAKLVVVACNTATIAGISWYREQFPGIPIVGVVPVIKTAASLSKTKQILVLSTEYTANSDYQKSLITQFGGDCAFQSLGSATLVPMIEKGIVDGPIVESELRSLLSNVSLKDFDVIVLGCTHYPFLKQALRAMIDKDAQILDSGGAVARQVHRILQERESVSGRESVGEVVYFTTGDSQSVQQVFSQLLKHDITVQHIVV